MTTTNAALGGVYLRVSYKNDMMHFSVENTVIGMNEDKQNKIFPMVRKAANSIAISETSVGAALSDRCIKYFSNASGLRDKRFEIALTPVAKHPVSKPTMPWIFVLFTMPICVQRHGG